jgi:hypothetical protein
LSEEECVSGRVVKLAAAVALNTLDGATKLGRNKGEEISESGEHV